MDSSAIVLNQCVHPMCPICPMCSMKYPVPGSVLIKIICNNTIQCHACCICRAGAVPCICCACRQCLVGCRQCLEGRVLLKSGRPQTATGSDHGHQGRLLAGQCGHIGAGGDTSTHCGGGGWTLWMQIVWLKVATHAGY